MDLIRVFARKTSMTPTDELVFYDEPPLFDLPDLPVCVSVTFSWDHKRADQLYKAWKKRFKKVEIGGPLYPWIKDKWKRFYPGRFLKEGITITSRGCTKKCEWCRVWHYEGKLREINIAPGHIIQDNNLFACSRGHIEKVFEMLSQQKKAAQFKGGLDIDYLQPWHVELMKQIRIGELWVACDCEKDLKRLDKARDLLNDFPIEKKRCYVLMGFDDDTPDNAMQRCEKIYDSEQGFLPFAQYYQPLSSQKRSVPNEWRFTVWKWSRPAAYRDKK